MPVLNVNTAYLVQRLSNSKVRIFVSSPILERRSDTVRIPEHMLQTLFKDVDSIEVAETLVANMPASKM